MDVQCYMYSIYALCCMSQKGRDCTVKFATPSQVVASASASTMQGFRAHSRISWQQIAAVRLPFLQRSDESSPSNLGTISSGNSHCHRVTELRFLGSHPQSWIPIPRKSYLGKTTSPSLVCRAKAQRVRARPMAQARAAPPSPLAAGTTIASPETKLYRGTDPLPPRP